MSEGRRVAGRKPRRSESLGARRAERRSSPRKRGFLLWGAGGLSAALLILGTNGTLSSWTTAIINNTSNTVATAQAVVLSETGPGPATCVSSTNTTNSYDCSTINKYGGASLVPGGSTTTDVTFTNTGTKNGANFQFTPGACTSTYATTSGGQTAGAASAVNLCTQGDLKVAVACNTGSTFGSGTAWAAPFAIAATAPGSLASVTHAATGGDLNAPATWTCRFTVTLAANAGLADQNIQVSQPITWTLS